MAQCLHNGNCSTRHMSGSLSLSLSIILYSRINRPNHSNSQSKPAGLLLIDGAHRTLWLISQCLNKMAHQKPRNSENPPFIKSSIGSVTT